MEGERSSADADMPQGERHGGRTPPFSPFGRKASFASPEGEETLKLSCTQWCLIQEWLANLKCPHCFNAKVKLCEEETEKKDRR